MKILYRKTNKLGRLVFHRQGDWIDLVCCDDMKIKKGDFAMIPLGIAMQLPKGIEAVVAPRSSTAKKYFVTQANSIGVIDNSYCGNDDEWIFPALAFRNTEIPAGNTICQFRLQPSQFATVWQRLKWALRGKLRFVETDRLSNKNRNGFGSTGDK